MGRGAPHKKIQETEEARQGHFALLSFSKCSEPPWERCTLYEFRGDHELTQEFLQSREPEARKTAQGFHTPFPAHRGNRVIARDSRVCTFTE